MTMTMSRRGKATLLSALIFGAALAVYFFLFSDRGAAPPARHPGDNGYAAAVGEGRSLGRRLGDLLKSAGGQDPSSTPPTHRAGPICDKCTTENCNPGTDDGCDSLPDPADRKACEDAFACFVSSNCAVQGDPIPCWCGTNMTTCVTDSNGPTRGNGPCAREVLAAAKTTDADKVFNELLNPNLPIGRAVRLTSCRGNYCQSDCKMP